MHNPEACDNCGITHTHVREVMNESGEPFAYQLSDAVGRLVRFYGFADDGTVLWIEAQDERGTNE